MKRWLLLCLCVILLTGCGQTKEKNETEEPLMHITAQQAKELMDTREDYIILDVRTEREYEEGHIPGAILIPDYELSDRAEEELTDKDQLILVYCRSGRRSKVAAQILESLGYTQIREFGGILSWPYEVE